MTDTKTDICPKCGAPLADISKTPTGRKLRRCSKGNWNSETRKVEGCDYVLWMAAEPETLDEKCPKCGAPLVLQVTRFGKKMKKCSTNTWDPETKTASGCDYVEWINGTTEKLVQKLLVIDPKFTVKNFMLTEFYKDESLAARLEQELLSAGLPYE